MRWIFPVLLLLALSSKIGSTPADEYEYGESVDTGGKSNDKGTAKSGGISPIQHVLQNALGSNGSQVFVNVGVRQDYLLQHCGEGNNLKLSFPDVDYAFLGYDILHGYPMAMGSDPGFTYPIFYADYSEQHHTGDCRYSVPRGLVVLPDVSCDVSFTSTVIKTSRQYESSLAVSAHVSGGGWGVQFSASAGYKKASSEMAKGEYSYILSTAKCNYYVSKLQDMKHPKFDESFLEWVHKLDKSSADEDYLEFFQRYGTHYPTQLTFGARYTHEHRMRSNELQTMESQGVNVAVAASYSGLFSVGGGFNLDSSQRSQASSFSQKVETKVISVGAAPPANGDAMTWASGVQQNPVPTSYELESIDNLFTERYMKDLGVDFTTIRSNLKSKRKYYWQTIQRQEGADNFQFDVAGSIIAPNWYVQGEYEEIEVTFTDCYRICENMGSECYGLSFCSKCVERSKSKCAVFGKNARSRDWSFDERWQTIIVSGKLNLKGMVISDTLGDALATLVENISGSTSKYTTAIRNCKNRFSQLRGGSGDKAVAYTFGFLFNEIFSFCKIYGSRRVFTLEVREKYDTFIEI